MRTPIILSPETSERIRIIAAAIGSLSPEEIIERRLFVDDSPTSMIEVIEADWSWDPIETRRLKEAKAAAAASKGSWGKFLQLVLEMPKF